MSVCPHCRAEHADDPRNPLGAVDICVVCGEWQVFLAPSHARKPTPAELARIARTPGLNHVRAAWEKMQRQIGNHAGGGFTFPDD